MGIALGRKPGWADIRRGSQTEATATKNAAELPEGKDGARSMKGSGSGVKGFFWSLRDLRFNRDSESKRTPEI
jgi:hypothetical protein